MRATGAAARGLRRGAVVVVAGALLAACGSDGTPSALPAGSSTPEPGGTPAATADASVTPSPTTSSAAGSCTSAEDIAAWPIERRAAAVLTVPVLDFDLDAVAPLLADGAGGVLFLGSDAAPSDLKSRIRAAVAKSTLPGGPLISADQEGGGIQRLHGAVPDLPWPADLATASSPEQVRKKAAVLGRAMVALGINVDLAPVLDVDDRPGPSADNPDGKRSFSGDPPTASAYGIAFMQGLVDGGVLPVVKHFPGLGGTTGNTDVRAAPTKPIATLRTGDLIPFQDAIRAGAPAVMVANATVPGLTNHPAGLSSAVIEGLLREEFRFDGLVVTDSLSAGAVRAYTKTLGEAVADAIESGADLVLFGSTLTAADRAQLTAAGVRGAFDEIVGALRAAVASGALTEERLNDAVTAVLTAGHADLC
ncbi:MAG TPA: glycoside hydrolase family 3 N-terminal domain-containing protein [Sporichthya sp.]|nr:glycoside hydrolase family 3 N-terminal domain-containing protein [Sporichthya sp.]